MSAHQTNRGVRLAIKISNFESADPCAICGEPVWSDRGPEIFMADSWAMVCCSCAREHAPELCALIWAEPPAVAAADETDPAF